MISHGSFFKVKDKDLKDATKQLNDSRTTVEKLKEKLAATEKKLEEVDSEWKKCRMTLYDLSCEFR